MKMPPKFPTKVEPGGLLHIPTPHHQNKKQPTSTGPNIREDYNYCTARVSYAEKKYFTFRMHPLLKLKQRLQHISDILLSDCMNT
jgi:hypothetical protein